MAKKKSKKSVQVVPPQRENILTWLIDWFDPDAHFTISNDLSWAQWPTAIQRFEYYFWGGLLGKFMGRLWYTKKIKNDKYDVEQFFGLIKKWVTKTSTEQARIYSKLVIKKIKNAHRIGQKSMIEELNKQLGWLRKEIQVINELWLVNYVYEKDIVDLESVGIEDRTIYRKPLRKYLWEIPNDCLDDIANAADSKLFDEIVIIYTRKTGKKTSRLDKTKKVADMGRKKVDPIAFGSINSTGKLFIITDWIDEECDLNVEKLEKHVTIRKI